MWETSRSVAFAGNPSTYTVEVALVGSFGFSEAANYIIFLVELSTASFVGFKDSTIDWRALVRLLFSGWAKF